MTRHWLAGLWVLAGVGLVAAALPGFAQDQDIQWKAFDKGAGPFYEVQTTATLQNMKVMGQDVKQEQKQTFYIKWTPGDKDANGNWVVTQQFLAIKMEIDIGGNKISYDSTLPNQPKSPLSDLFDGLLTAELKFHVSPADLSVRKIDGVEELLKKLT